MVELRRRLDLRLTVVVGRLLVLACLCSTAVVGSAFQQETAPGVVVNPGRYSPYYHLRFELTAAAIDFSRTDRKAGPGGQFTIRLHPPSFPVAAPSCRRDLILRMPWTPPGVAEADRKVAAKSAVLDRILAMEQTPGGRVPVVLELNPYVRVVSQSPLTLQLTECNVFFRQVAGEYVDDTEPRPRR